MSIFEAIMLICFGSAWPFSIYRSYASQDNSGKSFLFLVIIFTGYMAGVIHKLFYNYDLVILLYLVNMVMVFIDMMLYLRNVRLAKKEDYNQASPAE